MQPDTSPQTLRIPDRSGSCPPNALASGQRGITPVFGYGAPHSSTEGTSTLLIHALPSAHYEPLRHPKAPSLSLAGFRLVIADHALGLPVFRALSLCTCRRHYPGPASERIASLISSRRISHPRQVVGSTCALSFSRIARRIAVGTAIAGHPPHRSGLAQLRHPAPTLGV